MMAPKEMPECDKPKDCRFASMGGTTTCLAWTPTVDRDGNVFGSNPNTTTWHWRCETCGKQWVEKS